MTEIVTIITHASMAGIILSVLLAALMAISFRVAPDMWVGDYPEDIQQEFGEMSDKAKRYRTPVAIAFFVLVVLVPLLGLMLLRASSELVLGIFDFALYSFVSLFVFNLFDLLILDWLIFVTIQPSSIVLPGTEGMAGYKDYGFHFRAFISGIGFVFFGSLIIAGLAWLVLQ